MAEPAQKKSSKDLINQLQIASGQMFAEFTKYSEHLETDVLRGGKVDHKLSPDTRAYFAAKTRFTQTLIEAYTDIDEKDIKQVNDIATKAANWFDKKRNELKQDIDAVTDGSKSSSFPGHVIENNQNFAVLANKEAIDIKTNTANLHKMREPKSIEAVQAKPIDISDENLGGFAPKTPTKGLPGNPKTGVGARGSN